MTRPLFSVITTSLNQGTCLRGAIESVLAQEIGPIEHIIVTGSSSEDTDELVSEYPHLTVIRGVFTSQAQALNQGFNIAQGEILSWLNPYDRYAPDAFKHVERQIRRHPVVMGGCAICDKRQDLTTQIDNVERSWFDTMKYWVSNAIPTQPAVFFKRSIFSELEIEPGEVFDESLHLVMDFDLWLRIQEYYPFSLRIPEVIALRKQGEVPAALRDVNNLQREMSRVFRRHASRRVQPEQNFSFVIPVAESVATLAPLLEQLNQQTLPSVEVVIADYSGKSEAAGVIREAVIAYGGKYRNIAFQYVALACDDACSPAAALDLGVRSARSQIVACLGEDREVPQSFALDALKIFSRDEIGMLLPSINDEAASKLFITKHGTHIFNPAGPFTLPADLALDCVVRKLSWMDAGGFALHDRFPTVEFSMKRLMVMLAHKAWRIVHEPLLSAREPSKGSRDEPFRLYENSVVVDEIAREMRRNPFSVVRAKNGFGLVLSEELWQSAQSVIQRIPSAGACRILELTCEELQVVAAQSPEFGPALYRLAQVLAESGDRDGAERVMARWREVHSGEKISPLYGASRISS